jgi:peptidoglycan/LPS O-acetylase OafA/YrhL
LKAERSEVIDLLKACACVLIVWHHLALYGPMSDVVALQVPGLMRFLYDHGPLAVQVFLVVAGYLSAKSWAKGLAQEDFKFFQRLWGRYLRLTLPLLAALSFAVLVTAFVRPFFDHASLSAPPQPVQVLAHLLLLQDVFQLEAFSAGVWYVAIDFQLFALALGCAVVAHRWQGMSGRGTVMQKALLLWSTLTLTSLFVWNRHASLDMWGIYFFGAYGLGLCVGAWRSAKLNVSNWHLPVLLTLVALAAWLYQPRIRLVIALLIALLLALYELNEGRTVAWLQSKWLQYLSDASYTIFLMHFGVSLLWSAVLWSLWPSALWANAVGMLISFAASIAMGAWLHAWLESKTRSWQGLLKWAATFVASCTAVMLMT